VTKITLFAVQIGCQYQTQRILSLNEQAVQNVMKLTAQQTTIENE